MKIWWIVILNEKITKIKQYIIFLNFLRSIFLLYKSDFVKIRNSDSKLSHIEQGLNLFSSF